MYVLLLLVGLECIIITLMSQIAGWSYFGSCDTNYVLRHGFVGERQDGRKQCCSGPPVKGASVSAGYQREGQLERERDRGLPHFNERSLLTCVCVHILIV